MLKKKAVNMFLKCHISMIRKTKMKTEILLIPNRHCDVKHLHASVNLKLLDISQKYKLIRMRKTECYNMNGKACRSSLLETPDDMWCLFFVT